MWQVYDHQVRPMWPSDWTNVHRWVDPRDVQPLHVTENYAIPSMRCMRVVAANYVGSLPATVKAVTNTTLQDAPVSGGLREEHCVPPLCSLACWWVYCSSSTSQPRPQRVRGPMSQAVVVLISNSTKSNISHLLLYLLDNHAQRLLPEESEAVAISKVIHY
jgi:hypothetical protein